MVEYELRMLRSAFRLNIKMPSYIFTHAAILAACLFVGYSFAMVPRYFLSVGPPQVLAESKTIISDMLTMLFALLLLYTVLHGLFGQGLRSLVDQADFYVLVMTPMNSRCIVAAKCVRMLVSKLSLTIFAFLVAAPVSLELRTPPALLAAALLSLTIYIEFLQVTSCAVRGAKEMFDSRLSSRARNSIKISAVMASAIVPLTVILNDYYAIGPWTNIFAEGATALWAILPSSLTADLVLGFMQGKAEAAHPSLIHLSCFFVGALALVCATWGPSHPEEFAPRSFPSSLESPLAFRIGRFLEKHLNWERQSLIILLKDIQLALRGALIDFSLLDFTLMYTVPLASWYFLEMFLPSLMIPDIGTKSGPLKVFIKELFFALALIPFVPSLTSFSREMGRMWLLKSFPLQNRAIACGKFLFALTVSAVSLAPMLLVAGLAFDIQPSEWVLCAVFPLILLIANSFGVLVGAYLPPYDLGSRMSMKSIVTFFIFLVVVLTPFLFVTSVQSDIGRVLLLAFLVLYSIVSTRFFLSQAGKGFEKLELREILPHEAHVHNRKPQNQLKKDESNYSTGTKDASKC